MDIMQLAEQLTAQAAAKRDLVVDTRALVMDGNADTLTVQDEETLSINDHAHSQLADRLKVPKRYYDRMRVTAPELLADNVNHWFKAEPEKRMVRTLDGTARAYLSRKYRRLDNDELMGAVLPALHDVSADILRCDLTDRSLHLRATVLDVQGEVRKGDVVQAGVLVRNSEVGSGALRVEPFIYRLVCLNGMRANVKGLSKYHVGRGVDAEHAYWLDDTIKADDQAFFLKVRDAVRDACSQVRFDEILRLAQEAADPATKVVDPIESVKVLGAKTLGENEQRSVLTELLKAGDYTKWGVANAVTATARETQDGDRAAELETYGYRVMTMAPPSWRNVQLATAQA